MSKDFVPQTETIYRIDDIRVVASLFVVDNVQIDPKERLGDLTESNEVFAIIGGISYEFVYDSGGLILTRSCDGDTTDPATGEDISSALDSPDQAIDESIVPPDETDDDENGMSRATEPVTSSSLGDAPDTDSTELSPAIDQAIDELIEGVNTILEEHRNSDSTVSEAASHIAMRLRDDIYASTRIMLGIDQAFFDGFELAAEQIQDKRIDFLEDGPELTASDLLVEAFIGFAFIAPTFSGPLIGKAIRGVARKARARAIKSSRKAGRKLIKQSKITNAEISKLRKLNAETDAARINVVNARKFRQTAKSTPEDLRGDQFNSQLADQLTPFLPEVSESLEEQAIKSLKEREDAISAFQKIIADRKKDAFAQSHQVTRNTIVNSIKTEKTLVDHSKDVGSAVGRLVDVARKRYPGFKVSNSIATEVRHKSLGHLRRRQREIDELRQVADSLALEAAVNADLSTVAVDQLLYLAIELKTDQFSEHLYDALISEAEIFYEHLMWLYLLKPKLGQIETGHTPRNPTTDYQRIEFDREVGATVDTRVLEYIIERFGPVYYPELYGIYKQDGAGWKAKLRAAMRAKYQEVATGIGQLGLDPHELMKFNAKFKGDGEQAADDASADDTNAEPPGDDGGDVGNDTEN